MRRFFTIATLLSCFFCVNGARLYAREHTVEAKNGMTAGPANYTFFTTPAMDKSAEALQNNAGFENHPELGLLFAETPCDNCYELLGKRTETSKTFIKDGTGGSKIMQQTSNAAMHYRDSSGNWLTIHSQLQPAGNGVYAAAAQPVPVMVNTALKFSSLGKPGMNFRFNNNLELIYVRPDGSRQSLGVADWSHHTAGDNGVYVTNAWPGVDMEMHVVRGAIKTNFWINHAMPAYAAGQLLIRDHLGMEPGWSLYPEGQSKYSGNLEIRNNSGEKVYAMSAATAFEKADVRGSLQMLPYEINGNELDIAVPGNFLNRAASAYPVIIDPLVSIATSSTVSGSTYSPAFSAGCVYTNPATVPAKVTVTDIQFNFEYLTSGGAVDDNGAMDFRLGSCRSPTPSGLFWNCNTTLAGPCVGTAASILPSFTFCMPPPQCTAYALDITMDFYQDYMATPACSSTYISAGSPLTITVFGNTIETTAITASPSTICQGQATSLTATTSYGVPPYTFVWSPGGASGSPVSVSPASTTTYTVSATDACGDVSTATGMVNVLPAAPITGLASVCQGGTTALSDATAGGTWSSSNTGVATVNTSGTVSGVFAGTSVISYTTPSACTLTTIVTVNPPVAGITGILRDCEASSITLSDGTGGGTWTSNNTTIATVNPTTGVVIGVSAGTVVMTYSTPGVGCYAVTTMTIDPLAPISGPATVCLGGTATLSDLVSGGTWASTNSSVASIGSSSGIVSGVSVGSATIIYNTLTGCSGITSITVITLTAITGTRTMCQGGSTTLNDITSGGTWSSSNTVVATVGVTSGTVSGVSGGTAVISYGTPGGCAATAVVTVNAAPPIAGMTTVCTGGVTSLTDASGGGTWTSSNTAVATVGISGGVVTGVAIGTSLIVYTTPAGCNTSAIVTVDNPTPITGVRSLCQGGVTTLADASTGGAWTSSNTTVASVTGGGIVTGGVAGTATISYAIPGGCTMTAIVTVNPLSAISGTTVICLGGSVTLGYPTTGGAWVSGNTTVATIVAATGLVAGVATGTAGITYTTATGCAATTIVTVNLPTPVIGASSVCQGSTTTLSNATTGGTWTSSNTSIAGIGLFSGVANGVSAGTATIMYTTPGGCSSSLPLTVNPLAVITGASAICQGNSVTLSNAVGGGTWSSTNTAIATINTLTGVVTGLSGGPVTIKYTTPAGCVASFVMAININPATIAGASLVCGTGTLTDAVSGGVWSVSNTAAATINAATGAITALTAGTVTAIYTMPGGCATTISLTINPVTAITGTPSVCQGSATALGYATTGGTWSSLNTLVATVAPSTGVVGGVSAGTAVISYTMPSGCVATRVVTVNALSPIAGAATVCQGSTITLADAAGGGTWSSTNTAEASVGATTGVVGGISAGTVSIVYTTAAGCIATFPVTVNPLSPITGITSLCVGNSTTLSDATTGGTWSSVNTAIATIDETSGIVTGGSAGATTVQYTTAEGCIANIAITIHPLPFELTGPNAVCVGNTITLTDGLTGGIWISGNTAVATINGASGMLSGVSAGTSAITYTTAGGCFVTTTVSVNPLPSAIMGTLSVCQGGAATLSDSTNGGLWSSINTLVASVDAGSGIVTGLSAGTATIKYTSAAGCSVTVVFTVNPLPSAITGTTTVCAGATSTLHNTLAGGTWSSANTSIATMGLTTGVLTGVSAGTATVSYITPFGCYAVIGVVVNPTPVITSTATSHPTHCNTTDGTIILYGLTAGETYTVHYSFGGVPVTVSLTADASGMVTITGLAAGTYTNINVTTSLGCSSNTVAGPIVLSLPVAPPAPAAANNSPICAGSSLDLTATDAIGGATYTWSGPGGFTSTLQNPVLSPSSVGESGAYTVTATYLGCISAPAVTDVVVHPIPDITGIVSTNPTTCQGIDGSVTLEGLAPGVSYTVAYLFNGNPVTVTLAANGSGNVIINNLSSGNYAAFNVSSFTCLSNTAGPVALTDPLPPPPPELGSNSPICSGKTLVLTSSDPVNGLTYLWKGPNGFTDTVQNPQIPEVVMADSGVYTLTIKHLNCPASASESVIVRPPVILTNVTASQTISFGTSKQLNAEGAEFYLWWPNDGTLSNPDIARPVATPHDSTTYIVEGVNEWGCIDSAYVALNVDIQVNEFIPNAFTPNGDGRDDIFRIVNAQFDKLIDFSIFNRWGQVVYHNNSDITQGWDGTFNGVKQNMDTYFYSIILAEPNGNNKELKGDVLLIR